MRHFSPLRGHTPTLHNTHYKHGAHRHIWKVWNCWSCWQHWSITVFPKSTKHKHTAVSIKLEHLVQWLVVVSFNDLKAWWTLCRLFVRIRLTVKVSLVQADAFNAWQSLIQPHRRAMYMPQRLLRYRLLRCFFSICFEVKVDQMIHCVFSLVFSLVSEQWKLC